MDHLLRYLTGTARLAPPSIVQQKIADKTKQDAEDAPLWSLIRGVLHFKPPHWSTIGQVVKQVFSGKAIPDRELLLERMVILMQALPANNVVGEKIANTFIGMLWNDLPHPAGTFLGPEYRYRKADGSHNNPLYPMLGAAGQPYSRTTPPLKPRSPALPDPELVFDQLLRRRQFIPHKAGLNRLFFSFATVVIHEVFQTNYKEPWINKTSSYVDLSTVYGNNQEEQNRVRTFEMGRIFPDTISSSRIMLMPPGPVAIVMLFSRHHNHIADRIFTVNECGEYKPWDQCSEEEKVWQDNDIFQLSRNVNVAFFAQCVLTDYVSAILNTVRANSDWHLDLGKEFKKGGTRFERGTGNSVSCEFNVLYHWHAALSASDEQWVEQELKRDAPDIDFEKITPEQFGRMMHKKVTLLESQEPKTWTFGGLQRNENGMFDDIELGELIKNCVEEPARAFTARGTPSCLKVVDIMGQLQARNSFHCATMNEFRTYLNLKKFKSFDEWNSDTDVAQAAKKIYGHIDNLELYPGLLAEEAKPNMPGSGVQPGHTIGRGILDDAIALVRGDRFLTYDLNISTLTSWGFAQLKPAPGAYGGFFPHLLLRALPNAWGRGYSSYSLLPFYTPMAVEHILADNRVSSKYNVDRPEPEMRILGLHSWKACKTAFENKDGLFAVPYVSDAKKVTNGAAFHICWDEPHRHDENKTVMLKAFLQPGFNKQVRDFYAGLTRKQIAKHSIKFQHPSKRRQLDVVQNIFNVVPVRWAADKYGIPLKTSETPCGLLPTDKLHEMLMAVFIFTSFNIIPEAAYVLRDGAVLSSAFIQTIFNTRYLSTSFLTNFFTTLITSWSKTYALSRPAKYLYRTLHDAGWSTNRAVGELIGTISPVAGNITQQPSLLLDLFLEPQYTYAKDRLVELAHRDDEEAWSEFEKWVWEGMRLRPIVPGLPRHATRDAKIDDGTEHGTVNVQKGDIVIIATSEAHMDPTKFPDPERMDPTRPTSSYIHMGAGMHFCFGAQLVTPAIVAMLREVFKLKNLRRANGKPGTLTAVQNHLGHNKDACTIKLYIGPDCNEDPIPRTMTVEYDAN